MTRDVVESALRRLPDVLYVGFSEHAGKVVVQVLPSEGADVGALRRRVLQLCDARLGVPHVVDVGDAERPARVRLLGVEQSGAGDDGYGGDDGVGEVVVHLAYGEQCQSGISSGSGPPAAAEATFAALSKLGAPVPFWIEAAATFEHDRTEGVMVVLGSDSDGPRFGVAAGRDPVQAGARATLHALNRYLATQSAIAAPTGSSGG